MRSIIVFISLSVLLISHCFAQQYKTVVLIDKDDRSPIGNAYISADEKLLGVSDGLGTFDIRDSFTFIQISHLNYKPLITAFKDITTDTIYLERTTQNLNEVIISSKKRREIILPTSLRKNPLANRRSYQVNQNSVYATYIPNDMQEDPIIDAIVIDVDDLDVMLESGVFAPFRVNLYKVNPETHLPDCKILDESILVSNASQTDDLVRVDIGDFSIDFPKEGIYVVVESLNLLELRGFDLFSRQSPSFRSIKYKNKDKTRTYSRIYSWNRLTRVKDTILKDWVDKTISPPSFVFNFGIEVRY